MEKAFAERNPLASRQPIQPVDFYQDTEEPKVEKVDNIKRSFKTIDRTVRTNDKKESITKPTSVLMELSQGVEEDRRPTERYSFEIFSDQKERIEELQYQYKRKTGKKLSSSRILREALEEYLDKTLETLVKS